MAAARERPSSARRRRCTVAATARAVTLLVAMNACTNTRDVLGVAWAKGPTPRSAPKTAIPESAAVTVAASRGSKRSAAQRSTGKERKERLRAHGTRPAKTGSPTARSAPRSRAASRARGLLQRGRGRMVQRSSSGATTRLPPMSPSHQVSQTEANSKRFTKPASLRLETPRLAPTAVLNSPANTANLKTLRARSKTRSPPAKRSTSQAPTRPSSVFPAAMPRPLRTDPAVVTLTRNAAARMAGQAPRPRIKNAARAMPLAGQTAEALALTKASLSPSLPAMK